mgnify:FL=1
MDWIDKWNEALEMLEKSLTAEISLDDIARTACCTTFHFQRMFSYLADMPLSEYIRRRKMTKAAFDLQRGAKVIDVALKYGYRSPTAFTRAFQSIHGITPSQAKAKGAPLKAFPPIRFQMTVKGVTALDYRMEAKGPLRIAGIYTPLEKDMEKNFQTVPAFWQKAAADNILPKLTSIMEMPAVLGISACQEEWKYWIGVCTSKEVEPPLEMLELPAATWAIFPGTGAMPKACQELEKRIFTEWLPNSGYEYGKGADIEVYYNADPADSVFEIWIPVVKKAEHI